MFSVPSAVGIYLNPILLIYFMIEIMRGYKKGFLMLLLDLCSSLVALLAAWVLAPVMAKIFSFIQSSGSGLITVDQILTLQVNRLIWFFILFVIFKILLAMVSPLVAFISKVPIIKQVNSWVGALGSVFLFYFKMLLLVFFLSFPIIKNGQDLIENSVLRHVEIIGMKIEKYEEVILKNTGIQSIMGRRSLNQQQEEELVEWLKAKGINEKEIKEYISQYE